MKELFARYKLYARARGFSDIYIGHVCRCVGFFDDFLQGNTDAGKVTVDDFRRFVSDLRDRPVWGGRKGEKGRTLSGTAINTYARAVKAFFNWLKAEGIIATNPLAGEPAPKKPRTLPKVYTEAELYAVFEAATANIRDEAVLYLFLDSGLRLDELNSLKMGDVDIPSGTLNVLGKGGIERFALFGQVTAASLERYVKEYRLAAGKHDALFLAEDGHPLSASGIQSLLERLGRKAGIKERLAPHKLRHSFATFGLKYDANLEYIKRLLGHSDIKTTSESYLNIPDADIRAAYQHFSPITNLKAARPGKGSVSLNGGRSGDQREVPGKQPGPKAREETSGEQGQLLVLVKELLKNLARDWRHTEYVRTETTEKRVGTGAVLLPEYRQRYDEHLKRLTKLTEELIVDIENGNVAQNYEVKTDPKPVFAGLGLGAVYKAQNDRLWPFLLQHLDFEFNIPPLGRQIAEIATTAFWARYFKQIQIKASLVKSVKEKLVLLSERGTFKDTCKICEGYFQNDGK